MKGMTLLRKAGFIKSEQGMNGGYRLAKAAKDITLYDIISTMQGEIWLHRCIEEGNGCNSNLIADKTQCPVHNIFESLQGQIITMLSSYSVLDICDMSKEKNMLY